MHSHSINSNTIKSCGTPALRGSPGARGSRLRALGTCCVRRLSAWGNAESVNCWCPLRMCGLHPERRRLPSPGAGSSGFVYAVVAEGQNTEVCAEPGEIRCRGDVRGDVRRYRADIDMGGRCWGDIEPILSSNIRCCGRYRAQYRPQHRAGSISGPILGPISPAISARGRYCGRCWGRY